MLFLVTGASGVGKTTVRKLIEPEFADFLEAGELSVLGSTPKWNIEWRHRMVERAVRRALDAQREGKHFLLCGDPVPPGEVWAAPSADRLDRLDVCFLDAGEKAQTARLLERGMIRTSSVSMWHSRTGCATMWLTTGIGRRSLPRMPGRKCVGIAGLGWLQSSRLGVVVSLRRASWARQRSLISWPSGSISL